MTKTTILVVEPQERIRALLKIGFELEDYRVLLAQDGREALTILQTLTVDLMTLEVRLPDMSGASLMSGIERVHLRRMPVMVLSSAYDGEEQARAIDAQAYFCKPFHLREVTETIARLTFLPQLV